MADLQAHRIEGFVREKILRGHLEPGDRVPSERDLAKKFETGRNSVREALRSLEVQGLITTGRGGNRVRPLHDASISVLEHVLEAGIVSKQDLIDEVIDIVMAIMPLAMRKAMKVADDESRAELKAVLERIKQPFSSQKAFLDHMDKVAHVVLQQSDSLVLMLTYKPLINSLEDMLDMYEDNVGPKPEALTGAVDQLIEAIDRKDGRGVAKAAHLLAEIYTEAFRQPERNS